MDANQARSIFAGAPSATKPAGREEPPINFKSTNESLVRRNLLYKQQLVQCTKTIETLRDENVALRQRNQELIDASDERKIEMIVEQRVQKRLAHAAVLNKRLVQVLHQTGSELSDLFKGLEPEPSKLVSRRAPKAEINLDKVEESPLKQLEAMETEENDVPESIPTCSSAQNLENGTPRKRNSGRGRRSELFQDVTFEVHDTISEDPCSAVNRRAPMMIAPKATPTVAPKKSAPKSITRQRSQSERFKKPSTPTVSSNPAPETDTTQVRRQRSAKLNIKTLKEPSLGQKLRRPGKHDEPMPYIGTFF